MVDVDKVRTALREGLEGAEASRLLAVLLDELTLAARGEYTVGGTDAVRSGAGLRTYNELVRVVAGQLAHVTGTGARGYPTEAFIDVVLDGAARGGVQEPVVSALRRALERTTAREPRRRLSGA